MEDDNTPTVKALSITQRVEKSCDGVWPDAATIGNGDGDAVAGKGDSEMQPEVCEPASSASRAMQSSSRIQMVLFSASLISPLACIGIVFFGKDIYVLKFAADVTIMGFVSTVLAILGPLVQPIVGFCMEKVSLNRFFPWETWGRRAPWFLTHLIGMAISSAAILVPPSFEPVFLCMWYLLWAGLSVWFGSVLLNSVESARLEIYLTKEDRSEVEAVIKITAGAGMGVGSGLPLIVAVGAAWHILVPASVVTLVVGLVSLVSLPVLRKARVAFEPTAVGAFFSEFCGLMRQGAVRHLTLYRFIEDGLSMLAATSGLYYLTFVEGLVGAERSIFLLLTGMSIGVSTIIALPFWTQFLRVRRRGVNINVVCSGVLAIGILSPIMLIVGQFLPPGVGFCGYCFVLQFSLTGQTFWRAIALGWVSDEDCHTEDGRRREAILVGMVLFYSAIGRAAAVGLTMLGLAFCGMESVNCDRECADQGDAAAEDCVNVCDMAHAMRQPAAVRTYLKVMYYGVAPILQVILTILVYNFPIHGARLDAIYEKQAQIYAASIDAQGESGRQASPEPEAASAWPSEGGTVS